MAGLGTVINSGAVLLGGAVGLLFGGRLTKRFQDILMQANGLAVIFIGIGGAMQHMLGIEGGSLSSGKSMVIIFSLILGALTGELMQIEQHTERFGAYLKEKTGNTDDAGFIDAFVSTSLTICVGAMAVVGALQDGLHHDISLLTAKAVLDLIIVCVMASSMGKGCLFSVIPLAVFQGLITALSRLIEPVLTDAATANLSMIGSMLIFCVGVNLMFQNRMKVANMLRSLVFAVAAGIIWK